MVGGILSENVGTSDWATVGDAVVGLTVGVLVVGVAVGAVVGVGPEMYIPEL